VDNFFALKDFIMLLYVIVYSMNFSFNSLSALKDSIFSKDTNNVLGIDIGSSGIKVVQLRKEKERAVLETYGEIAVGPYNNLAVGQAVKLSEEKAIEVIKDVLKEANVKAKKVVASIPLKSSFVTVINMPIVEGKDISEMIELEARRYIPIAISEVEMDWWVFPETVDRGLGGGNQEENSDKRKFVKVLLVAIHKDIISKYKDIISKIGLELLSFEVESFSMIRASIGRETSPVVVIDLGASSVKMAIVDFGMMIAAHSVGKGSQDLTSAISHSLGIDFSKAEEMKREIGLSDLPEHKEIKSIMDPILAYIFSEVGSVVKDYQSKYNRTVSKVILTGGGSLLKGVSESAKKRLGLEVELADPFSKTGYPAFLSPSLKKSGPVFSVSLGLALRGLQ